MLCARTELEELAFRYLEPRPYEALREQVEARRRATEGLIEELTRTVDARHPDLVVLAATLPENLEPHAAQLTALARRSPLALAGAGATPQIAAAVGARLLTGDPVTAAENIQWPR